MRERSGRRAAWTARGVAALAAAAAIGVAGGCVGVTDRADFDAEIDSRGGGLGDDLVPDALAAVGDRLGTPADDLSLLTISVSPGDGSVVMTVRDPAAPGNVDRHVYRANGGLDAPEPVQVSATDDLDATSFLVAEAPALEATGGMTDAAFAELGFDQPHVESLTGSRSTGEIRFQMTIESDRARGRASFDADGTLIEAVRE